MNKTLLSVKDLNVAYGKAKVVHGVSLDVKEGEFVVLLGTNGAGKSTILHAISGLIPKLSGQVVFDGQDISSASAAEIVRSGIIQILQGHRVFTALTVEDNLLIGTYAKNKGGDKSKLDSIYEQFPELTPFRHLPAARLSGGQQQILAVAQGVIGQPKLLILDEPSLGLAPMVIDRILSVADDLCKQGIAILLVEQLVEKALKHAHSAYLLNTGRVVDSGPAHEIVKSDRVTKAYLG